MCDLPSPSRGRRPCPSSDSGDAHGLGCQYHPGVTDVRSWPTGVIEVETGYPVLFFTLALFSTRVAIDGQFHYLPWGTHTFRVAAGRHYVRVWHTYLIPTEVGANEVDVDVASGQTVRVVYRAPWIVYMKGKLRVEPEPSVRG